VDLVAFDGRNVDVHLGGACEGCPLRLWTLRRVMEKTIRDLFPNVQQVTAV
jgi:Fe-S cluster biogenesis protein NfuA